MKSTLIWALAAFNVLLLAALAARLGGPNAAHAQVARPGEYIMLPATVVGGAGGVIYVIDTSNDQLSVMALDGKKLVSGNPIDLNRVFNVGGDNAGGRGARN